MKEYNLNSFGNIDPENLTDFYTAEVSLNGTEIELDLNFDESTSTIGKEKLEAINNILLNLSKIDTKNKQHILDDYNNETCDTVKDYVKHHLEELDKESLSTIINFEDSHRSPENQMVEKLHLVRIGFYPENEKDFAVCDYTIGRYLADYMVVVNLNENGEMQFITMES